MLEGVAAEHDLVFMPAAGLRHDGMQVFIFGGVPVVLDSAKQLIYAKLSPTPPAPATFVPATLRQLLAEAKARGK